jgi:alpha-beta hydrolase superfamily lysophospholipase
MPPNNGMRERISELYALVPQVTLPVLIMAGNGGADGKRSEVLFGRIGSKDSTLKLYEGLLHEIFNEPEHPQVLSDLEDWLKAHL